MIGHARIMWLWDRMSSSMDVFWNLNNIYDPEQFDKDNNLLGPRIILFFSFISGGGREQNYWDALELKTNFNIFSSRVI